MSRPAVRASVLVFLLGPSVGAKVRVGPDYVDISRIPGVSIDLRYATSNNFVGQNMYGEFSKAYLHKAAAPKLRKASELLQERKPGWTLVIFDALRPLSVQRVLWGKVKGTEKETYVANPEKGSIHNYGFALDLSLRDDQGKEIDMGTPFDDFRPVAQPRLEESYLAQGQLSPNQLANRLLLRDIMEKAGFIQVPEEWWHFDALPLFEIKKKYRIVD